STLLFADHIAGKKPAITQDRLRLLRVLVVAGEHHVTAYEQFTVFAHPALDSGGGSADGTPAYVVQRLAQNHAGGFGQAIHLDERHAERTKVPDHGRRDGGGARKGHFRATKANEVQ